MCPGGLMDKVVDSGSTDAGSIPVRDARKEKGFKFLSLRPFAHLHKFYTNAQ